MITKEITCPDPNCGQPITALTAQGLGRWVAVEHKDHTGESCQRSGHFVDEAVKAVETVSAAD